MSKIRTGRKAVNNPESPFSFPFSLSEAGIAALAEMPKASAEIIEFPLKTLQAFGAAARGEPLPTKLEPSREQLAAFVRSMFKHATPGAAVSLRAFLENSPPGTKAYFIVRAKVTDNLDDLIEAAIAAARRAARAPDKVVFAPPIATFNHRWRAREEDLAEGPALSVECDAGPASGRSKLEALIAPAV